MAHAYAHLYRLPATGLRFFTVYGPWGRPDMSLFIFTRRILEGRPIEVFNQGRHQRDFTYIDDVVEGVVRVLDAPPQPDPHWSAAAPDPASGSGPYRIYNLGRGRPVELLHFIELIEQRLGRKAVRTLLPMQPGDVPATWADTADMEKHFGYAPATSVETGVGRFIDWYLDYYGRQ
jgi:UDP-glucuronate 4-epimerase